MSIYSILYPIQSEMLGDVYVSEAEAGTGVLSWCVSTGDVAVGWSGCHIFERDIWLFNQWVGRI